MYDYWDKCVWCDTEIPIEDDATTSDETGEVYCSVKCCNNDEEK